MCSLIIRLLKYQIPVSGVQTLKQHKQSFPILVLKYQIPVSGVQTTIFCYWVGRSVGLKYQIPVSGVQTKCVIAVFVYVWPEIPDSSKWSSNVHPCCLPWGKTRPEIPDSSKWSSNTNRDPWHNFMRCFLKYQIPVSGVQTSDTI